MPVICLNTYQVSSGPVTVIFTATDTWQPPAGLTMVDLIEAWGGGGGGGTGIPGTGGGGGGSGAYTAIVDFPVDDQTVYDVTVGAGGHAETSGEQSTFIDGGTLRARAGAGGAGAVGGTGAATSTGDVAFGGADGGASALGFGGGGGAGAAGTTEDGHIGGDGTALAGGAGGIGGVLNGGAGGGGVLIDLGTDGAVRGAGGGGGGPAGATPNGGNGGRGEIRITYTL